MPSSMSFRRWVLVLLGALLFFVGVPAAKEPGENEGAEGTEATKAAAPADEEGKGDGAAAAPEGKEEDAGEEKVFERPEKVAVGFYLNDIQTIDLKTHSYAVDAYVWFRWKNPELDPATAMEFVNPSEAWGHILTPNYEEPKLLENGELYQVVRFTGRFSKKLPLYNYPFDRQTLVIGFEDSVEDASGLVYVADGEGVTVNPAMVLPGYNVGKPELQISTQTYATNFGDLDSPQAGTYSRAQVILPIHRPPLAYATKLLLPVLCVVVCAALMFLLSPAFVDARVDVGITALLTIVALQMTFNQDVPDVGYLMLMDKIYLCAYIFVISGLVVVVRSTRMHEAGREAEAVSLHRRAMSVIVAVWAVLSGLVIIQAMMQG